MVMESRGEMMSGDKEEFSRKKKDKTFFRVRVDMMIISCDVEKSDDVMSMKMTILWCSSSSSLHSSKNVKSSLLLSSFLSISHRHLFCSSSIHFLLESFDPVLFFWWVSEKWLEKMMMLELSKGGGGMLKRWEEGITVVWVEREEETLCSLFVKCPHDQMTWWWWDGIGSHEPVTSSGGVSLS